MEILNVWKGLGKYEKRLCFLLLLSATPNAIPVLFPLIAQYTPPYHCDVAVQLETLQGRDLNDSQLTSLQEQYLSHAIPMEVDDYGRQIRSSCMKYNLTDSEIYSLCCDNVTKFTNLSDRVNIFRNIVKCKEFTFDFVHGETSAIDDFEMVCDNAWKGPTVISVFMFGKLVASLISGIISDKLGRRFLFLTFTLWQYVVSFAIGFSTNYWMYVVLTFLNGMGSTSNYSAAFVLGLEIVGIKHRNFVNVMLSIGYSFGYMLVPLLGFLIRDWRWFARVTGLVGVLYIPLYWYIDESPRWLFAVGRDQQAYAILRKIAKYNGKKFDDEKKETYKLELFQEKKEETMSYLKTFKILLHQPRLIFRCLILMLAWFTSNTTYYMITLNTNSLTGNRFLNCFYAGLTEFVCYCIAYPTIERFGRKGTYIGFMIFTAIAIGGIPLFKLWNETVLTVVTMGAKLSTAISYYVIYIVTSELFPTAIRHTIMGVSASASRIGAILSPFMLHSASEGSEIVTSLVCGIVIFVISVLFLFMPNTHNVPLPQTIQEAIDMKGLTCCCKADHSEGKSSHKESEHVKMLVVEARTDT